MFRKKSDSGEDGPKGPADDTAFGTGEPTPPKVSAPRGPQAPVRPPGGAGFHPDIPKRPADPSGAPKRPEAKPAANAPVSPSASAPSSAPSSEGKSMANSVDKNTLIVGEDIRLKGEITSCDKLVVEGHVEVSLTNGRQIEVGPSGVFTGQAEVQEADVSGHFDGELTAHEQLVVRSTGHITGKIRYGRIVIEAGGEIIGAVEAMTGAGASKGSDKPAAAAPAKKTAPELEMTTQQE